MTCGASPTSWTISPGSASTASWLPPFYPSPLRDGGYDISDYEGVLPEFGTIDDFTALLKAAHERGIKVIIDFVMNHTSDQHRWFQASRKDPNGPYGNYLRMER